MAQVNPHWARDHSGPLTPRQMSAVLTRIAAFLCRSYEDLALTKMSRERNPFHLLVACLISLRTKDEVTDVVAPRLLREAPTPLALSQMPASRIARVIYPVGFYRTKARTLRHVSRVLLDQHQGQVPDTLDGLLTLKGVGRKTANLVLTLGFGKAGICVDTHVHRISNRLGFAKTSAPDDTEQVLRARLPLRWWIPVNDLLVAFGRTHCKPISPLCSTCPVRALCHRVDVDHSR